MEGSTPSPISSAGKLSPRLQGSNTVPAGFGGNLIYPMFALARNNEMKGKGSGLLMDVTLPLKNLISLEDKLRVMKSVSFSSIDCSDFPV